MKLLYWPQSELLTRFQTDFISSVWNFCCWGADISPYITSQVDLPQVNCKRALKARGTPTKRINVSDEITRRAHLISTSLQQPTLYNRPTFFWLNKQLLFRSWACAHPPKRQLDMWVGDCQFSPIRLLPAQIMQLRLLVKIKVMKRQKTTYVWCLVSIL